MEDIEIEAFVEPAEDEPVLSPEMQRAVAAGLQIMADPGVELKQTREPPKRVITRAGRPPIDITSPEVKRMLERMRPRSLAEIKAIKPPQWLIARHIPENSLIALFGRFSTCKSFLAMAWGLSIAAGKPWLGRRVQPGDVFYVSAEGTAGIVIPARIAVPAGGRTPVRLVVVGVVVAEMAAEPFQAVLPGAVAPWRAPPAGGLVGARDAAPAAVAPGADAESGVRPVPGAAVRKAVAGVVAVAAGRAAVAGSGCRRAARQTNRGRQQEYGVQETFSLHGLGQAPGRGPGRFPRPATRRPAPPVL